MKKIFLLLTTTFVVTLFGLQSTFAQVQVTLPAPTIKPAQQTYCSYTNITSNLWMGNWKNNKNEVRTLQNFLFNYYGVIDEINATGYFGKLTKNYVSQFQREHSVYPVTGGVGPLTRSKIKSICGIVGGDRDEHGCIPSAGYTWCAVKNKCLRTWEESCGKEDVSGGGPNCKVWYDGCNTCSRSYVGGPQMCTLMACMTTPGNTSNNIWNSGAYCKEYFSNNVPPVIKEVSGPVQLLVGEKGTWKISASIYNNQPLSYKIVWGDENFYNTEKTSASAYLNSVANQNTTFEHSYGTVGTYTIMITVTSQDGQSTKTTQTVKVISNNTGYCTEEYNPVCGQPKFYCAPNSVCAMMMPAPKTYSNICNMNRENAEFLYYGSCRQY